MQKIVKKVNAIVLVLCLIMGMQMTVSASEITDGDNNQYIIFVDSFDDIMNEYDCQEGVYLEVLEDGLIAEYNIDKGMESTGGGITARSTSTIHKKEVTLTTTLKFSSGALLYRSRITGTFKYDGTYAWGTSGTAYFEWGSDVTKYVYTANSYSSSKIKGKSYYNVSMTITSSTYGKIYLSQYVACDGNGNTYAYDSRKGAI